MQLCIDIGNSHIFCGLFEEDRLLLSCRYPSQEGQTSDKFGIFLKNVIREHQVDPAKVTDIAMCSVVPSLNYSVRAACIKYFEVDPFVLQAGVKTGLKIRSNQPQQVGSDRIANAIAAIHLFKARDLIIIDFGTATTLCAINANQEYLGGVIMAGLKTSMDALHMATAQLPPVPILKPVQVIGRSTVANIQSGLYYGAIGGVRCIIDQMIREAGFQQPAVVGTGGFAHLFEGEGFFDAMIPDLALQGLRIAYQINVT